ncbi:hypothetical protein BD310DRAFT_942450 [Dichomitus squalens]|uniref:Uncharacterized protein n=1 Tax=Dichomitus squalens TaxID=114155 RepID=A0A4Q9P9J5_9APHY|nr:hypothetical protein BD310DRAFT_942450 [Dichomitus squalens]
MARKHRCAHTAWQRNACTLVLGCPHTTTITDRLHPVVVSLSTIASFAMEERGILRYSNGTTGPNLVVEFAQWIVFTCQ